MAVNREKEAICQSKDIFMAIKPINFTRILEKLTEVRMTSYLGP